MSPKIEPAYGQDIARGDVLAVMDALGVDKAHIVGHSMGAYTALHVGLHHPERCRSVAVLGCGWGSNPADRDASAKACEDIAAMFEREPMKVGGCGILCPRADGGEPSRPRIPRGFAEFERMLGRASCWGSGPYHAQFCR